MTSARRQPRGLTMMELLAVVVIVCALMAIGAGAYWKMSRNFREQAAASQVDVALRQARNSALHSGAPAFVEIDTQKKRVVPWAYRTVGTWHFEDKAGFGETRGPYGHNARLRGAELRPEGKVGKCVRLTDGAYVEVPSDPDFDLDEGGYLEAYVRPADIRTADDNYIFCKKNSYELKIGGGGKLIGNIGKTIVKSDYRVPMGRWTKLAMAWDRSSLRLMVDDGIVAVGPGASPPLSDHPLLIGNESGSIVGLVDEVRVMSASAGHPLDLPPSYTIQHTLAPWSAVYFASDGSLDMRYHPGPVSITLVNDLHARKVTVSMLGSTSKSEVEKLERPEPK